MELKVGALVSSVYVTWSQSVLPKVDETRLVNIKNGRVLIIWKTG